MWDAARFWLDFGVDGYRLDAIGTIYEDPNLTPHNVPMDLAELRREIELAKTPQEKKKAAKHWLEMFQSQWDQPGVHGLMKELRAIIDEYDGDRMLVGEDDNITYMGDGNDELQLVFNFPLMRTAPLTPTHIRRNQQERLAQLDALPNRGWPCNTLGNHDTSRMYTFFGNKQHDADLARIHAALVLTLKGTPFLYNGEEIGMTDYIITDPEKLRDSMATWYYDKLLNELHVQPEEAARRAAEMTRDKNRTPMQWTNQPNGGFSPPEVQTWLPVNPNYRDSINVKDQERNPNSLLNYYKNLLRVRKNTPALIEGDYVPLHLTAKDYLAFLRVTRYQTVVVVLNFSEKQLELNLSLPRELKESELNILFSSAERSIMVKSPRGLVIGPFEAFISEVQLKE